MALSMVMNMLMASSRKAGRKGLLFRTWQIGARLHADGVSFPGVKGKQPNEIPLSLGGPETQGSGSV